MVSVSVSQAMRTLEVVTLRMWKLLTEGRGQSSAVVAVTRGRVSRGAGPEQRGPASGPARGEVSHFLFWVSHNFWGKLWHEHWIGLSATMPSLIQI